MSYPQSHPVVTVRQRKAINLAQRNNNKLIRHGNAYWAEKGWNRLTDHFSTRTIQALVQHGFAKFTAYRMKNALFGKSTEITLTEKGKMVQ